MRLSVVVACCSLLVSSAALADKAYVVASDQPAFAEAARAAIDALGGEGQLLRADESAKSLIAGALIVIAVGPLADRVVSASLNRDARVVECLTPRRASGVSPLQTLKVPLHPAASEVFELVREVLPRTRRVAVFPAAGESRADIDAAAHDAGLDAIFPRTDEPFGAAVDRLVDDSDVVWIADATSLPTGGPALVVKKAAEARKQVIGPNRSSVQRGAFFAVVPDPAAHGRAAGEAALRMLHGDDVRAVPAPLSRIVFNAALARSLNVTLPASLAHRAEAVE